MGGCCGFPAGGGGGGTGNLSGTLTAQQIPVASGVHTLADSGVNWIAGLNQMGIPAAGLFVSPIQFQYVDTYLDGAGNLDIGQGAGVGSIKLNTTKFTVDMLGAGYLDDSLGVGADIMLDGALGLADVEFLHVHSSATIDGLLSLGASGLNVNSGKFTIDGSTGDAHTEGELSVKEQATFSASTVLGRTALAISGGAVAVDAYLSDFFTLAVNASAVLSAPTNAAMGRRFILRMQATGVGANDLTFDPIYVFPGGAPVIDWSTTNYFYLGFCYRDTPSTAWDCLGPVQGPF